jgi:hypothetical protein
VVQESDVLRDAIRGAGPVVFVALLVAAWLFGSDRGTFSAPLWLIAVLGVDAVALIWAYGTKREDDS